MNNILKFSKFEKVRWYSKGKLQKSEENFNEFELNVGDIIKYTKNAFLWYDGEWKGDVRGGTKKITEKKLSEDLFPQNKNFIGKYLTPPIEKGVYFYKLKGEYPWQKVINPDEIEILNNEGVKWYSGGKLEKDPDFPEEEQYFVTDTEFREFLEKHDAYDGFVENFKKRHPNIEFEEYFRKRSIDMPYEKERTSFVNSFGWGDTREGGGFWSSLNQLWQKRSSKKS